MAVWSIILVIQGFLWIAEATSVSRHVSRFESLLDSRSTGRYIAVLGGNGMVADGWPSIDQWFHSFEDMFESNMAVISGSCSQWSVPNNSDGETDSIKNAILQVERSSAVDARFILSIVMQESQGCVRVPTTDNGVTNPGLMQSHNGPGSCNHGGVMQNPCPENTILQMIKDGVEGTSSGPGLKTLVAQEGGTKDVASFYKAARAYNSGAVAPSGNLGQGTATHCYASDIANRLLGWTEGSSLCAPNAVGRLSSAHLDYKSATGDTGRDGAATTAYGSSVAQFHGGSDSRQISSSPSLPSYSADQWACGCQG